MKDEYNKDYADWVNDISEKSAGKIIPLIMGRYSPESVVDFGCGRKAFLNATGLEDTCGVDMDYVEPDVVADLNQPIDLNRRFDLVISLEVAEHLEPESAETFVDTLCRHGDLIIFSAAIPGAANPLHLNEQYWEYWIEKFKERGFVCEDWLRDEIWDDQDVAACYKNDVLIFHKKKRVYKEFQNKVHPEYYGCMVNKIYNNKPF